jgi:5-formyltetrahydrofolate cyclo-ligase
MCDRVLELESFQRSMKVAGFLAFDGESDPRSLMMNAIGQGKQVYIPTIVAKAQPLMFVPWTESCQLAQNPFGILEPVVPESEWIEAKELEFVITPLVAFDETCNRIGVGGGFYDRSFAFRNDDSNVRIVHLCGFAFELQKIGAIQPQGWDVPLDNVATESRLYSR